MTDRPHPLVAGNWKMNGHKAALDEFTAMARAYDATLRTKVELLVCPPATLVNAMALVAVGTRIGVGGQDCHARVEGAHTGDISAEMLSDAGAGYVIVGHSERRTNHKETDATVKAKAATAQKAGLRAIICIGESLDER